MPMITMQKAKSPSYVTIRTTPFRWGVANRLAVVTVFRVLSVPGNDNFGNASLGGGVCALSWDMCLYCTQKNIDDTRRLDCRPGERKSRGFPGLFCGSSVKTHDQ